MDVLFHQLHIPGKTGLGFAENDLELLPLCRGKHPVKVRAEAVCAGVVLVAVDEIDIPAVVHGVGSQQGLLILDAFRLSLMLVFILFTQAYIDRA